MPPRRTGCWALQHLSLPRTRNSIDHPKPIVVLLRFEEMPDPMLGRGGGNTQPMWAMIKYPASFMLSGKQNPTRGLDALIMEWKGRRSHNPRNNATLVQILRSLARGNETQKRVYHRFEGRFKPLPPTHRESTPSRRSAPEARVTEGARRDPPGNVIPQ